MEYKEFLIEKLPEILWDDVIVKGSYSQTISAFGIKGKKPVFIELYNGSCSFCGSWDYQPPKSEELRDCIIEFNDFENMLENKSSYSLSENEWFTYVKQLKEKFLYFNSHI